MDCPSPTDRRAEARVQAAAALLATLLVSLLVWRGSSAAFTATTDNRGNSWATGTITLTDNDAGSALFDIDDMHPGQTVRRCIEVAYDGTVPVAVRLYGAASGDLAPYLDLTVERGLGLPLLGAGDCTGFVPATTDFSGTLEGFVASHGDHLSGVGGWTPAAADSQMFRLSVTLRPDPTAQGRSAGADFVWEARS